VLPNVEDGGSDFGGAGVTAILAIGYDRDGREFDWINSWTTS
jgi:hypothetical protein